MTPIEQNAADLIRLLEAAIEAGERGDPDIHKHVRDARREAKSLRVRIGMLCRALGSEIPKEMR